VELDDRRRWDEVVQRVPHSFSHTWEHCRAHSRPGERHVLVHAVWSTGEAYCPLRIREGRLGADIATPFGYSGFTGIGDLGEFPGQWEAYARSQPWMTGYLVVNPWLTTPPWQPRHGLHAHNVLLALDLSLGPEALYERLSRTRRRALRRWQAKGRSLVADKKLLRTFVQEHADSFFDRVQAAADYRLGEAAWDQLFASDNVLVLGAADGCRLVAVMTFGDGTQVADAMFNISLPAGRDATTFLLWSGALHFAARGRRILNIGGGSPRVSLAESKRRFGGEEVQFTALRQVYDWARYEASCREAGCDTSTIGVYFPPYRAPG
jgi:hypothetical protein